MPDGTWILNANGNWSSGTSWAGGTIASGVGATADLRNDITLARSVALNLSYTVGNLLVDDAATASASVTLTRSSTSTALSFAARTIRIRNAAGTVFFTNLNDVSFAVGTATVTGQTFVSETEGASNNVASNTLTVIDTGAGLSTCTNPAAATGGGTYYNKNITTASTTLTFDAGANKPTFVFDTACVFSPRLGGSNGVFFTTSRSIGIGQYVWFNTSNVAFPLTGVVKVDSQRDESGNPIGAIPAIYVGPSAVTSGLPQCFDNIDSWDIQRGIVVLRGATAYTMSRPFTLTSLSQFQCENAGGITFSDNASVEAATGGFYCISTAATNVNGVINFNRLPTNANLGFYSYVTNTVVRDMRIRMNTSGLTSTHASDKEIVVYGSSSAATSARGILEDNGLQTTYNSRVRLNADSLLSIPLVVTGTNPNITFAGPIIREGRTTGGVFSYPNETNFPLTFSSSGTVRLTGENTYNGLTTISSGTTLVANRSSVPVNAAGGLVYYTSSLGTNTGGITVQSGGVLELADSIDLNKGTSTLTLSSTSGSATAVRTPNGSNATVTCGGVALATTVVIDTVGTSSLTLTNSGQISGVGHGLTKNGAGTLTLVGTNNNFTGVVTVSNGTLNVTNLQNIGTNSTLGTGAANANIQLLGGRLRYTGDGSTTNRTLFFPVGSATIESSGTGALNFSATTASQGTGNRTITLTGTNTGDNRIAASISNGSSGTVSINKSGAGKWILSGAALNYTGSTIVTTNGGQLDLGGIDRTMSGTVSIAPGGTLSNGSGNTLQSPVTVLLGGALTAPLAGTTALSVTSTTTALFHVPNGCTTTGTATIQSTGQVTIRTDARPYLPDTGKVLSGATVVNGTLRTYAGGNQKGQARYGGNLTFNSGAVLHIGGAA
jgi:autotransporter-associated beta strand protein